MRPLVLLSLVALAGCGYVGDPQPPALNIPVAIQDLRAVQRAGTIIVEFTPDLRTTDGLVLRGLAAIEVRAGSPPPDFTAEAWAAQADVYPALSGRLEIPAGKYLNREITFGVRTTGPRRRQSAWSNFFTLRIAAPLPRPDQWTIEGTPEGVRLLWPGDRTARVYRQADGQPEAQLLGAAPGSFTDRAAEIGKSYLYRLQYVAPGGQAETESELSEPRRFAYSDAFPPAVPTGLTGVPGLNAIELTWDRNAEPDFKAYQVYRADGEGGFEKLGEPVSVPAFRDAQARSGRRYRYRLSAIDQTGNESTPSAPVEVILP